MTLAVCVRLSGSLTTLGLVSQLYRGLLRRLPVLRGVVRGKVYVGACESGGFGRWFTVLDS